MSTQNTLKSSLSLEKPLIADKSTKSKTNQEKAEMLLFTEFMLFGSHY